MSKPRYRPPSKARCLETIRTMRQALRDMENELDLVQPTLVLRHRQRMNSILGAGIIRDVQTAVEQVQTATKKVRLIRRDMYGNAMP